MKKINKVLALALTVVLVMSFVCVSAFATTIEPGNSGSVSFVFNNVYSVDGVIGTSGDGITITEVESDANGDCTSEAVYLHNATLGSIVMTIYYTVDSNATEGVQTISFNGTGYDGSDNQGQPVQKSASIYVSTPATPTTPGINSVDTTELKAQIAIAENLKESEYSAESWIALTIALENAKDCLYASSQGAVDNATAELKNAIAALVKIDRAALIAAIDQANATINNNESGNLWKTLLEALEAGNALLDGRSQAEIDVATADLLDAIKAVEEMLAKQPETIEKIVEVEKPVEVIKEVEKEVIKEVPVEVPVESSNPVWVILLIISIVINVGLAVLVVLYFIKKKSNQRDNTPLVRYNIEEDDK